MCLRGPTTVAVLQKAIRARTDLVGNLFSDLDRCEFLAALDPPCRNGRHRFEFRSKRFETFERSLYVLYSLRRGIDYVVEDRAVTLSSG